MKNKKKLLIISIFIIIIVIVIVFILVFKKDKNVKISCIDIEGGSYNIIFNSNEGSLIDNITVNIESDNNIEIPESIKSGYNFIGWYLDNELNNKLEVSNVNDIESKPIKENGCIKGYEDINLYAKWEETSYYCDNGYTLKDTKCIKIETVSAKQTKICSKGTLKDNNCVLYKSPNKTKDLVGSNVIQDNTGSNPCDQYAVDGKEVESFKIVNNDNISYKCKIYKVSYSCPDGYSAKGTIKSSTKCSKVVGTPTIKYSCSKGKLNGTNCVITTTKNAKIK